MKKLLVFALFIPAISYSQPFISHDKMDVRISYTSGNAGFQREFNAANYEDFLVIPFQLDGVTNAEYSRPFENRYLTNSYSLGFHFPISSSRFFLETDVMYSEGEYYSDFFGPSTYNGNTPLNKLQVSESMTYKAGGLGLGVDFLSDEEFDLELVFKIYAGNRTWKLESTLMDMTDEKPHEALESSEFNFQHSLSIRWGQTIVPRFGYFIGFGVFQGYSYELDEVYRTELSSGQYDVKDGTNIRYHYMSGTQVDDIEKDVLKVSELSIQFGLFYTLE